MQELEDGVVSITGLDQKYLGVESGNIEQECPTLKAGITKTAFSPFSCAQAHVGTELSLVRQTIFEHSIRL